MIYDNSAVRRQDRLLSEQRAIELLKTAEYGVLSLADKNGNPYGIPINYVWDGADSLLLHCAPDGRKTDALAANPNVSFCIVGNTEVMAERFTTAYESIIITGKAELVEDFAERREAIRLMLSKLSAQHVEHGMQVAENSMRRVAIIKIRIEQISGKCKKLRV